MTSLYLTSGRSKFFCSIENVYGYEDIDKDSGSSEILNPSLRTRATRALRLRKNRWIVTMARMVVLTSIVIPFCRADPSTPSVG
jgi:hypothetical protein